MNQVFLALGSNQGDRERNLAEAVQRLGAVLQIVRVSDWLETVPQGGPVGQGMYLNGVVEATTPLAAREVLATGLQIEKDLGRQRGDGAVRWGPRPLDIDLLFFNQEVIDQPPELLVPHPRLAEREFVLRPLFQIAPELQHPVLRLTVREMLERLSNQ